MKNIKLKLIGIVLLMAGLCSCDSQLDIPKHGSLDFDTFYKTDKEAESAIASIYLKLRDMEFHYKLMKNLFADDFWPGGAFRNDNVDLESMNEFTFDTNNSYIESLFIQYYNIVYRANVVLAYVEPDTEVKAQMVAEAKVFRAWAYFELTSLWGNPPLVEHPLSPSEYERPNATSEELWGLVERDLTEAIESGHLKSKKSVNDNSNYRVTKEYAYALLGKAYLWQKKYTEASAVFEHVIGSGLYALYEGDYGDILTNRASNCSESLFESNRVDDPENVYDNYNYYQLMINWRIDHFGNVPSSYGLYATGYGYCTPRKSLYDAFVAEEGENGYRLNHSIKTYDQLVDDGATLSSNIYGEGYFNWKIRYEATDCPGSGWGCSINNLRWMRYAEVLLCAAEANFHVNNQSKVKQYMDLVRSRARVSIKPSYSLLDIKNEKRLELYGECVRYQDLIRWADDNDGTGASTVLANQGREYPIMATNGIVSYSQCNTDGKYGFKEKHKLLPYPYKEISQNSVIIQNPGWE